MAASNGISSSSPLLRFGTAGSDVLTGATGDDTLIGGRDYNDPTDAADTLFGDTGNDWLYGNGGDDWLYGGHGSDRLYGGFGQDVLYGGTGETDTADAADVLDGQFGDDRLYGNGGNDQLIGGYGSDTLYGGTGDDRLWGGTEAGINFDGNDHLIGGQGSDWLSGGDGNDVLYGGTGLFALEDGNDTLLGGDGNDALYGNGGNDWLEGGSGADTLIGGAGGDTLMGGAGNDVIIGDRADMLVGGAGEDTFIIDGSVVRSSFATGWDAASRLVHIADMEVGDRLQFINMSPDNEPALMVENGQTFITLNGRAVALLDQPSGGPLLQLYATDAADTFRIAASAPVTPPPPAPPPEFAPSASADAYTVAEDGTLTVTAPSGLLANDTDPDGDPLSVQLASGPSHGALTLNIDGSFIYTPDANFAGTDSFQYTARDGSLASSPTTVTLTVTPVNDAPIVASALSDQTAIAGSAFSFTVPSGSFTDVDSTLSYTAILSDGSALPSWLSFDGATRSFGGTPAFGDISTIDVRVTASDGSFATSDVYQLTVGDSLSATNLTQSESYTEDTPEDATAIVISSASPSVTVSLTLDDPAAGTLSVGTSNLVTSSYNSVTGVWTASGATADVNALLASVQFSPTADAYGDFNIDVSISNGVTTLTGSLAFTGTAVNDAPVSTVDSYTIAEDGVLNGSSVLANDTDVEGSPLTATLVTDVAHGTLAFNSDGTFTYTPTANYSGNDSFTYRANDGTANGNTVTVSLTVSAVNDAPAAVADSYSVNEDATLTVNAASGVLANDSDVEGSALSARLVSDVSHGTLTLNTNGGFTYAPTRNYNGADSFTYKVNDGTADGNTVTVTLTVNPVNDLPVAVADSYSVNEDATLTVNAASGVLVNDSDVEGSALSAVLVTDVAHGTLTLNANGSFSYVPTANYSGSDSFTYKVSDGTVDGNTVTVTLMVNAVNDAPVAVADSYSVNEDATLTVNAASGVLANDSDVEGSALSATLVSDVSHGTLTLNANGSFTYVSTANYGGADSFTYKVNDGTADGNTVTVTLTVNAVNDAPTDIAISNSSIAEDAASGTAVGTLSATDIDSSSFTYTLLDALNGTATAHGKFEIVGDEIRLKSGQSLDYETTSSYTLYVRVSDGTATYDKSITVSVTDVAEAVTTLTAATNDFTAETSGNDAFSTTAANWQSTDTVSGGAGSDTLTVTGGTINVDLATYTNVFGLENFALNSNGAHSLTFTNAYYSTTGFDGSTITVTTTSTTGVTVDAQAAGSGHNLAFTGGSGGDTVTGGFGDDVLNGGDGDDYLTGWGNNDTLIGGNGNDTLNAAEYGGTDSVSGGAGNDLIYYNGDGAGVTPPDTIAGGTGTDTLETGGAVLYFNTGTFAISGVETFALENNAGHDLTFTDAYFSSTGFDGSTVTVTTTSGTGIKIDGSAALAGHSFNLTGGSGGDTLTGGAGADTINGGSGNDTITGGTGNNQLYGGDGNDSIVGGSWVETLSGGAGNDTIFGDSGADLISGDTGNDLLNGGAGNDTITGGDDQDILNGNADADSLDGGNGNDTLAGGSAADTLTGGTGSDRFVVTADNNIQDTVTDFENGIDQIDLSSFGYTNMSSLTVTASGSDAVVSFGTGQSILLKNTATSAIDYSDFVGFSNAAPVNTVPGAQSASQNTAKVISGLSIADADGTSQTVTLSVVSGTISINSGVSGGLAVGGISGNGTASVTLTGSITAINATIANATGVTYTPANGFSGSDTLTMVTSDGTASDTDTVAISVASNAPSLTGFSEDINYTAQSGASQLLDNDVVFTSPASLSGGNLTVRFTFNQTVQDNLTIQNQGTAAGQIGLSGTAVTYGGTTIGILTANGQSGTNLVVTFNNNATATSVDALIQNLLYRSSSSNGYPSRSISVTVTDGNGASSMPVNANINYYTQQYGNTQHELTTGNDNFGNSASAATRYFIASDVSKLNTGDTLAGGTGSEDSISVARGVVNFNTANYTTITGVERFYLGADAAHSLVFGSAYAGGVSSNISIFANKNALTGISVDASTFTKFMYVYTTAGADTILAGNSNDSIYAYGGDDSLSGGLGADSVYSEAGFSASATIDGGSGAGIDTFTINNQLLNYSFSGTGVTGFESILLNTTSAHRLTFNDAYMSTVNGSTLTVTFSTSIPGVYIDASAVTLAKGISTTLYNGNDTFLGGAGVDLVTMTGGDDLIDLGAGNDGIVMLVSNFTSADTLKGGSGTDQITFTDAIVTLDFNTIPNILGFETLNLSNTGAHTVTLTDALFSTVGFTGSTFAITTGSSAGARFDASAVLTGHNVSLSGGSSGDTLIGGAGNDTLSAGAGNNSITGGDGNDSISSGAGNDTLYGGIGNDTFSSGAGIDYIEGGDGNDLIYGATGNATILGGLGNDSITITGGDMSIDGGDGDDRFYLQTTSLDTIDTIQGSAGIDTLIFENNSGASTLNTSTTPKLTGVESFSLANSYAHSVTLYDAYYATAGFVGNVVNIITGTPNTNGVLIDASQVLNSANAISVQTGAGADTIRGGAGNDTIAGLGGANSISGGDGNDSITAGTGADSIAGGNGNDTISGGNGNDTLDGGDGNDSITAGGNNETIIGGLGNDTIATGSGSDSVDAGDGDDVINMSANLDSPDTLIGGTGYDTLNFSSTSLNTATLAITGIERFEPVTGVLTITFHNGYFATAGFSGSTVTVSTASTLGQTIDGSAVTTATYNFNITTGTNSDTVRGGAGNDTISAGDGANRIFSNGGDDSITSGSGNDSVDGGAGNDTIVSAAGTNTLLGGLGNDTINLGAGFDNVNGGDGDDLIVVSGTDYTTSGDVIDGGLGLDTMRITSMETINFASVTSLRGVESFDLLNTAAYSFTFADSYFATTGFVGNTVTVTTNAATGITLDGSAIATAANNFNFIGANGFDTLRGGAGNDTINGGDGQNRLFGNGGNDVITSGGGTDSIEGGAGNDTISSGGAADTINGGAGFDFITGGGGNDSFIFTAVTDSGLGAGNRDIITDFGTGGDILDLSAFAGTFTFRAGGAGEANFTGSAAQIAYGQTGGNTIVYVDTDGNGASNFHIELQGLLTLSGGDFLL